MKKLKSLSAILLLLAALVLTLAACDEATCQHRDEDDNSLCDKCGEAYTDGKDKEDEHIHSYTVKSIDDKYFATAADCENAAYYYYSCACGEAGTELFSVGEVKGHTPITDPRVEPTFTNTGLTEGSHCGVCNKVFVEQEIIPMRPSKSTLTSKTLTQNGSNLDAHFANNVTTFNFAEDITVTNNGIWVVSLDIYGMQTAATKMVPLNEGVNTFYIYVTNPDQSATTYTVSIYRNHMYTVKFNSNGGTDVQSQSVEEGYLANEPIAPTKAGYTFVGWDYDFTTPVTANITVKASWNANTDTAYKVEYYLENVNKSGYDLIETVNLTGTTDTTANADKKAFEYFTINTQKSILSGNINGDGTLVLKVYYTRHTYTVTTSRNNSNGTVTSGSTSAYGKEITISASPSLGYGFNGWYNGDSLISAESSYTLTVTGNIELEARFAILPEMENFEFTSNSTTCTINGIKDKAVTQINIPDYVTTIGSSAFKDCTSLVSVVIGNSVTTIGALLRSMVAESSLK